MPWSSSMEAFNEWFIENVWEGFGFKDIATVDDELFYGIRNNWIKTNE